MEYEVRQYRSEDEDGVLELLRLTLPSDQWDTPALWRWKHFENPFGDSIVTVAESSDGRIVGLTGWMKWRLERGRDRFLAGRPVDTATHPEFQRRGVFSRLTKLAEEIARRDGLDLSISTPNEESCPGFLKLGWTSADTRGKQLRLVRPIRAILHAAGLGGSADSWQPDTDRVTSIGSLLEAPGVDELVGRNGGAQPALRTQKSLAYLKWRYQDSTIGSYYGIVLPSAGEVEGVMIVRPGSLRGMRALLIQELFAVDEGAVKRILGVAAKSGADLLRAYYSNGSANWAALAAAGFKPDPSKTQLLITKPFSEDAPQRVSFSLGDIESL